ncbi:copper resistance protein CopC [Deinococcus lacus]|uniref:Copper resistance protein CopC n=1 Tax=Deinococcus lacus TaxID=392561 RepID=A0ABW1Y9G8_9DEIO
MRRAALLVGLAWLGSPAAAHAGVTEVSPPDGSTLIAAPREVTLRFTEPVGLRFSVFKVYPLPAGVSGNRALTEFSRSALRRHADEAARADLYRPAAGRAQTVRIPLKPGLKGRYAVMWKVMSADGHPVSGQATFSIR